MGICTDMNYLKNGNIFDQNAMDILAIVSFLVGIANYNENLTQSDKDDIIRHLDQQTRDILHEVQRSLEKQNNMLEQILERLGDKFYEL